MGWTMRTALTVALMAGMALPGAARTLSVRDFGAAGDGRRDDAPALQRALKAARAGDEVLLPAGTYLVATTVRLASGVGLRGAGPVTILRYTGSGRGPLAGDDVREVRVSDLCLEGSGTDAEAEENGGLSLRITQGPGEVPVNLTVERVRISGFRSSGVTVTAPGQGTLATGVTVRDCAFADLGLHGVLGYFARNVLVEHCRFQRLGRSGTIFPRCREITIRGCHVTTTGWHGLEVGDESEGFLIEGNLIEDSGDHAGILVEQAAHRGVIAHNRIIAPRFQGLQLNNKPAAAAVREVTVTGNFIDMQASARSAILVYGDTTYTADDCVITDNTIRGGQIGLEAHYLKRCLIAHNAISGAAQGLALVFLNAVSITGNVLSDCTRGGVSIAPYAEVFTNADVAITGNMITATGAVPGAAISLKAVRGGLVRGNALRGFAVPVESADCTAITTDAP